MSIYAIRRSNGHADLIFHGGPEEEGGLVDDPYQYQWRLDNDETGDSVIIKGQQFESFVLTTETITDMEFEGWFLYCERVHERTHEKTCTERTYLHSDIDQMLARGVTFNDMMECGDADITTDHFE